MPQACLNCRGINPNPDNDFCPICTERILEGAPPALQVESERRGGEMNTGTDSAECHGTDEIMLPTDTMQLQVVTDGAMKAIDATGMVIGEESGPGSARKLDPPRSRE